MTSRTRLLNGSPSLYVSVMSIYIRQAKTSAECAKALELNSLLFPNDHQPTEPSTVYWLAYDVDGPCAFAAACPDEMDNTTLYLSRCGVLPRARGLGLQKRLIRARLAFARRHGYLSAVTDVWMALPRSLNSLTSCGFNVYQPAHPWAFKTSLYLHKLVT